VINENRLFMGGFFIEKCEKQEIGDYLLKRIAKLSITY